MVGGNSVHSGRSKMRAWMFFLWAVNLNSYQFMGFIFIISMAKAGQYFLDNRYAFHRPIAMFAGQIVGSCVGF